MICKTNNNVCVCDKDNPCKISQLMTNEKLLRQYSVSVKIQVEADVESISKNNIEVYKDYMKKLIKHIHPMGAVVDYDGTCVEIID